MRDLPLLLCASLFLACSGQPSAPPKESQAAEASLPPKLSAASSPASNPDSAPSALTPPPAPAPTNLPDPGVAPVFGAGPVEIVPPVPPFEMGMMDHAHVYGWSKDSSEFAYCVKSGGSGETECHFLQPNGKSSMMSDFDEVKGEPDPKRTKAIEDRIKKMGYGAKATEWPYASDLVIAWEDISDDKEGTTTLLKVGAKVREAKDPVYVINLKEEEEEYMMFTIHPEVISISPDGKYLGVISHAFGGEFTDTHQAEIIPVEKLAGQVYNTTGYEQYHKKGDYAKAAELFWKAAYAWPDSPVAMYNLACALARLQDPGAKEALKRAIEKDGAKTKEKAKKDPDFEAVRGEAWFQELTR